jgi:hypothetical protein
VEPSRPGPGPGPAAAAAAPADPPAALVEEAARRSKVCWVAAAHPAAQQGTHGGSPPQLVWFVWHDGAVVLVSGEAGQVLAWLGATAAATVTMRAKDTGALLVTWPAAVEVVPPEDPRWEGHAAVLLAARLNLADPEQTLASWRRDAAVVRLAPAPAPLP